ncbi:MAG TPA: arylamine N-acetyltransferase [Egibacteraceae bacterium]
MAVQQATGVDLAAYLDRIGYDGDLAPTLDTLAAIHRAHVGAIPFENLDVALEREIRLDPPGLEAKLVRSRRGGYCFEHGSLLAAALIDLGFAVTRHAARVRDGSDAVRPRSHMCLSVVVDEQRWLVDTGFGGDGLLWPLRFGSEATQGSWGFRLVPDDRGEAWRLQTRDAGRWRDLYAFGDEPHHPVDFEVFNHYTATGPRSPFRGRVVAQRAGEHERRRLVDTTFTITGPDGVVAERQVEPDALAAVLDEHFGIAVSADEAARLAAVAVASAARRQEGS